jgi:hypothetical protein
MAAVGRLMRRGQGSNSEQSDIANSGVGSAL